MNTSKQSRDNGMAPIEDVIAAIARGEMIVMVDDEDRENEGDLIMAAQFATAEKIAFIVRHTSGVVVAPLSGERCDDLRLPLMVDHNTESHYLGRFIGRHDNWHLGSRSRGDIARLGRPNCYAWCICSPWAYFSVARSRRRRS
jgi:hypothetical protein